MRSIVYVRMDVHKKTCRSKDSVRRIVQKTNMHITDTSILVLVSGMKLSTVVTCVVVHGIVKLQ